MGRKISLQKAVGGFYNILRRKETKGD